jgi:hypothetical protein
MSSYGKSSAQRVIAINSTFHSPAVVLYPLFYHDQTRWLAFISAAVANRRFLVPSLRGFLKIPQSVALDRPTPPGRRNR